jgi:deoxyhypusine synthase
LREIIKFLCEHKMIDVLVTTAGGIEEDFIKCLGSTVLGDFAMEGAGLRKRGWVNASARARNVFIYARRQHDMALQADVLISTFRLNRIGNLLVPNSNYCAFEDWVVPLLDKMLEEQEGTEKKTWTPSEVIRRLGKEINNEESVYYWCYKVSASSRNSCLRVG